MFPSELPFHRWSATSLRRSAALTSIRVCTRRAEFPQQGARPTTRRVGVDDARGVSPFVSVAKAGPLPARLVLLVAQSSRIRIGSAQRSFTPGSPS